MHCGVKHLVLLTIVLLVGFAVVAAASATAKAKVKASKCKSGKVKSSPNASIIIGVVRLDDDPFKVYTKVWLSVFNGSIHVHQGIARLSILCANEHARVKYRVY
ncbi:hypothetical protein THASP1DRAFT_21569 [Thamnocephalis sphaerospora]|uniref:Uncharacterized protein n=1 Tax=Thamnocephalis sphaerospora TaxID=78915 RepID=A0A4V1IXE2_9FUNG|nr:hypothetical protein THASP1DRAFT_21569 [Thamnocephalis sphaerospora]|eukprot:RKP10749.1 hypothetical protein THASP1DRAFT_21569 [Thamnocephalis sphaerospora]